MAGAERLISKAFTLIELLISVAIATIIVGAVYFSLDTALESWSFSRDQLALQKVLNEAAEEIISGGITDFGLRDLVEIVEAGSQKVDFVPPWVDDTHTAVAGSYAYTLNRRIKPGTAVPIGEVKLPEAEDYDFVPIRLTSEADSNLSRVRIGITVPSGSQLRFTYSPDPKASTDVIKSIWYSPDEKKVFARDMHGTREITKNSLGVEIVDCGFKFYDNKNNVITESSWVDLQDLNLVTGIEFMITARLGQYTKTVLNFVSLRNAPMRSGYIPLSEGTRIPIPDSKKVHTLQLLNLTGIDNEDVLQLEARPASGKDWRLKVEFSRIGSAAPKIEKFTIEYPLGHLLYTEYPRMGIDAGFNLLALDANGYYDYDDDQDTEDIVMLEGDVILEIKKMDLEGVGLFVRP